MDDLKNTVYMLNRILNNPKSNKWSIYYTSSW
jgi:hypothetical protein